MRATFFMTTAERLIPPHRVCRPEQVNDLAADMLIWGWNGDCLIGYRQADNTIQLLSGTHRRAAAELIGLPVPVRVYEHTFVARCYGRLKRWQCLMQGRL